MAPNLAYNPQGPPVDVLEIHVPIPVLLPVPPFEIDKKDNFWNNYNVNFFGER